MSLTMWTVSIDFFWNIHANRIQLSNKETHAFLYLFRLTDRKRLTDQSIPKKPFIHPEDNLLQFGTIKENMLLEKQLFTVGTIKVLFYKLLDHTGIRSKRLGMWQKSLKSVCYTAFLIARSRSLLFLL